VNSPELVREACRAFPGRIVIGIDARDGKVATNGWVETSSLDAGEMARSFEDAGAAAIIYTDIRRDGMLSGPNVAQTLALAHAVNVPVIASGGVADLWNLIELKRASAGSMIQGAIIGRALYDGRIDPAQALAAVSA